jgi:hypothetical protein
LFRGNSFASASGEAKLVSVQDALTIFVPRPTVAQSVGKSSKKLFSFKPQHYRDFGKFYIPAMACES